MSEEQAEYLTPVSRWRSNVEQRVYWLEKAAAWHAKHRDGDLKHHEVFDIIKAVQILAGKIPSETTP